MKKKTGKYFKIGISILIPIALVFQVLSWFYNSLSGIVLKILPNSMTYEWWYVFVFVIGTIIAIFLIGFLFSFITPLRWAKNKIEEHIVNRIPVVNKVYNFGKEISDSFITDIKEDGDLQVIEIDFGGLKSLGVLTDEVNGLGFLLSAPSPITGFVFKLPNYKKIDMTFLEAVQINTSLGKIGGEKWVTK